MAHLMGMIPLLNELVMQEKRLASSGHPDPSAFRFVRQQITEWIGLTNLQISSTASEMDCEEERADQVATYLVQQANGREQKLTVASLTVGALTSIISIALFARKSNSDALNALGIGGGAAGAGLGLGILLVKQKVPFQHPRNPLGDLWTGPDTSSIFPPLVWAFLNQPTQPGHPSSSVRRQLLERWNDLGQLGTTPGKEQTRLRALFFGTGGTYTADELQIRANMLDQLESEINLIKQDLATLQLDVLH
ncbi:hypothetical protein [Spirosoma aerophilum]